MLYTLRILSLSFVCFFLVKTQSAFGQASIETPSGEFYRGMEFSDLRSTIQANGVPEQAASQLVTQLEMAVRGKGCFSENQIRDLNNGVICNITDNQTSRLCYSVDYRTGAVSSFPVAVGMGTQDLNSINLTRVPGFSNRQGSELTSLGPFLTTGDVLARRSSRGEWGCQYEHSHRLFVEGLSTTNSNTLSRGTYPLAYSGRHRGCGEENGTPPMSYRWSTGSPVVFGDDAINAFSRLRVGALYVNYSPEERFLASDSANYDCGNPIQLDEQGDIVNSPTRNED